MGGGGDLTPTLDLELDLDLTAQDTSDIKSEKRGRFHWLVGSHGVRWLCSDNLPQLPTLFISEERQTSGSPIVHICHVT